MLPGLAAAKLARMRQRVAFHQHDAVRRSEEVAATFPERSRNAKSAADRNQAVFAVHQRGKDSRGISAYKEARNVTQTFGHMVDRTFTTSNFTCILDSGIP